MVSQAPPYRTFFGQRVWPAPILKLYFPFFISGPLAFFLFSYAHTKMMGSASDKWVNIVNNVRNATEQQKLKQAAQQYAEAHKH
ncbi:uncharacterized protein EV422DRAFT_532374 [Fimicolochytrium jonesii]|uniref:uncharacterized protein n=1 Tax=Fimicolochytrium jonesii TaxID=1396493 RepID=UPI0022FEE626|nr:uncharacterized protein EV422DRAFT_532374 [Fimicolochytrium jonesii]KAI8819818.1 hypothetical protein EV422DRAFT_532374 [Fimicolochytrium jonesii]